MSKWPFLLLALAVSALAGLDAGTARAQPVCDSSGTFCIDLTPAEATNTVGTLHTVTATVSEATGAVQFDVSSGPCALATGSVSGSPPSVSFSYTCDQVGTDTILATWLTGEIFITASAVKHWVASTPSGDQGCTPGYWKQSQHFDSWTAPYDPSDLFADHFEDAFSGMTLLQVLEQGGGGLKALGRHTVAALLNAASGGVNYALSTADVISGFNAVFPGGDYEALKDQYAAENEKGCPLN